MRHANIWASAEVVETSVIAKDIRRVVFTPDTAAPVFDPGSHLRIEAGSLIRSYTCVPAEAGQLAIAVKRHANSRGGSDFVWALKEGDRVRLTMPENRFELSWRAPEYLMIAGGIGITPILGMVEALAQKGAKAALHYGAEDQASMAYQKDLAQCLGAHATFYEDKKGERPDLPALINSLHPEGELYACGPLPMLEAIKAAWTAAGRPVSRLRYEVFGDNGAHAETAFEVEVQGLNKVIEVSKSQTLLAALEEAGVDMIFDCQRGECGLCAIDVVSADAPLDHRDVFFSDAEKSEGSKMCACVSRLVGGRALIDVGYRATS